MTLSKSLYIRGLQCEKSLWLKKYKPEILTQPDDGAGAIFQQGTNVGELACKLYPNGTCIEFDPSNFAAMISKTNELIKNGKSTIYEATFCFEGLLVMVDILQISNGKLTLNEVKSSTGVKDVYLSDIAVQYFVISRLGYEIERTNLIHINSEYIRGESLELDKLFTVVDLSEKIVQMQDLVPQNLAKFQAVLDSQNEPDIDIGTHCSDPYGCDAWEYCWQTQRQIPEYSVFNISRLRSDKKFELYKNGIINFSDIKDISKFNSNQQIQINAELSQSEYIDKAAIREFLDGLKYPIYHLDFETFWQAVPEFVGLRPYEQIPFQFSIHKDDGNGNLEHFEFLAPHGSDPRRELAERLVEILPQNGCILAYNMSFEKGVIRRLAENFADLKEPLLNICEHIGDLMTPFANKSYYSPKMRGSYSIKYVLPALIPEFETAYESLNLIHHGGEAMSAYANMSEMSKIEQKAYHQALLRYCELDTLAMVKVLDKLEAVAK